MKLLIILLASALLAKPDTVVKYDLPAPSPEIPLLQADRTLDDTARILAGMDVEADSPFAYWMEKSLWKKHKKELDELWSGCGETLDKIGLLAGSDFADINDRVEEVFYPFSGPDVAYVASFYPKASHYWLFALEGTGSVPNLNKTSDRVFEKYRTALFYHLKHSYFITRRMQDDLHNSSIDGTISILMVFMARMNYRIMSVEYKTLHSDGSLTTSAKPFDAVEIHFFRPEENREKVLTFLSTNLKDGHINSGTKAVLEHFNPETTVGYTKSCSYCMHGGHFSTVRGYMLGRAFAIIQDDTGVRYSVLKDDYDITLYGGYVKPLACFSEYCYQADLDKVYHHHGSDVRPISFHHGYNRPSSLIVARKK